MNKIMNFMFSFVQLGDIHIEKLYLDFKQFL